MIRLRTLAVFFGLTAIVASIAGCGGGGEGTLAGTQTDVSSLLSWNPPETTIDNNVIDPFDDLDYYEIYVREDRNFTDADSPVAQVDAVEEFPLETGSAYSRLLVTEFDLDNLQELPAAKELYVSLRAVGTDRQKSAFMEPILWVRS
ncbi:MAG: hypothetical protein AB1346_08850 [Thermodesulfobacteriota bacterium]